MQALFGVSFKPAGRSSALATLVSVAVVLSACAASNQIAGAGHAVQLRQPLTPELESVAREAFSQSQELRDYLEPFPPEAAEEDQELPLLYGAFVDLADDGNPAALFYIGTPGWCGSVGCPLEIFRRQHGGWQHIGGGDAGSEVVFVLDRTDNGFHRIEVGGPTGCTGDRLFYWSGTEYLTIDPCPPGKG